MAPGYKLLPLVTLHLSDLDATPTGLAALRGHEGNILNISLHVTDDHSDSQQPTSQ